MIQTIQPHYDNLIIGFGKGGKTLAAWLAKNGAQVALLKCGIKCMAGRMKKALDDKRAFKTV